MEHIAGWVAPAATMIAAVITASNLGARVTGCGFVVFLVGSLCWTIVGAASHQPNLLWTNGFLTVVNGVGIWRWLGRQARYEDGSRAAETRSAERRVPTLFSAAALPGRKLLGPDGAPLGTLVDGMLRCADGRLAYLVVRQGGVAGVGEQLHALEPEEVVFTDEAVECRLDGEALARTRPLTTDAWPASLDEA
jgi:hypothetical protein